MLLCLAPFCSFINRADLPNYAAELQKLEPFRDYDFANFERAIQEAMNWGLLSPIFSEDERLLTIQPVFPYFLQVRLNEVEATTREALREGFKNHYRSFAGYYYNLMQSKDAQEKQLGTFFCRLEYENLYSALQISLEKQESISIFFCLYRYFCVGNDIQGGLKVAESVNRAIEKYPSELIEGELGQEATIAFDYLAMAYLNTKQYEQAKDSYEKELGIIQNLHFVEECKKQLWNGQTYHQLGIVAHELRQWDEAKANYLKALEIYVEFSDRYEQAGTYFQLGRVAEETEQIQEAIGYYLQDLEITKEFNDEHGLGISIRNLSRFYPSSHSDELLAAISEILGVSTDDVRQLFAQ